MARGREKRNAEQEKIEHVSHKLTLCWATSRYVEAKNNTIITENNVLH